MSRLVRLAVLDTYGVRWSRETFARDILQNFFDATLDFKNVTLSLQRDEGVIEIRGPVSFDLDLLAYLGATTKNDGRTAGGFGEGFKICALVGVRDFGLRMTAGAAGHDLEVTLEEVPLGRELCYRITERAEPFSGSYVKLERCDADCYKAFKAARNMFRHPQNPGLQTPLVEDAAQGVALFVSPFPQVGELYYRRQLRGTIRYYSSGRDGALSLCHDGPVDILEGDRDRRDLSPLLLAQAIGQKLAPESLHKAILHLMPYWEHGNEVLSGLLFAAEERGLRFSWPPGWLASTAHDRGLTALARRQGFRIALAAFAKVGMPTALDRYSSDLETRAPTPEELARLRVLAHLYHELNGKPSRTERFEVFDEKERAAVLGQHLGDRVIVGAHLLAPDRFPEAAGTVLHELAHEAGGEESDAFLLRLKKLLGGAIASRERRKEARERFISGAVEAPLLEAPLPEAPLTPGQNPSNG